MMNYVEPIRDKDKVKAMHEHLCGSDKTGRNAMLFLFGIHLALRISDLIKLQVSHIFTEGMKYREYVRIEEQKTKKFKLLKITDTIKKQLKDYIVQNQLCSDDYLFFSMKNRSRHVDRVNVYRFLNKTAKLVGIDNIGTHTLRKTFGYHFYQETKDLGTLMKVLNHSSESVTLRYIGINQEKVDNAYSGLNYNLF